MFQRSSVAVVIALFTSLGAAPLLAATFTVNSPSDVNDSIAGNGLCETAPGNGVCTLRAAIQEANALAGSDIINLPALPAPNAYVLTIAAELTISGDLTINGGGAATTIIDGNRNVRPTTGVLSIFGGTVTIGDVTLRNGNQGATSAGGGGIVNLSTLTLTNSTVSGNSANQAGGIYNQGTLTLIHSTVTGNSTIDFGGGILNNRDLTLVNSTVSGNTAARNGGGVYNNRSFTTGTTAFVNTTISGNSAGLTGGGVYSFSGAIDLFNATIANNLGNVGESMSAGTAGAGVFVAGGTLNFQNTIILGNLDNAGIFGQFSSDCIGTVTSLGNNVIGNPTLVGCTVNGGGVTFVNSFGGPYVGLLQDNGGPTKTHALLANNPALNGGNVLGCRDQFGALLTTDQRGFPRPSPGTNCDAGAFEFLDSDSDGVDVGADNCALVANPEQCDSDADGYGNRCDGDLNNNNTTNAQDVTLFRQQLGQPSVAPTYNKADINCNGTVNAQDVTLFRQLLGNPPGPSGLVP